MSGFSNTQSTKLPGLDTRPTQIAKELFNMPWVLKNEALRVLLSPFILAGIRLHGIQIRKGWRVFGMPVIQKYRGSVIEIGKRVELRSWRSSNPLTPNQPVVLSTRNADAQIKIGDRVGMTGVRIISASSISIGKRVLIGANSTIIDTDFHPIEVAKRLENFRASRTIPIVIEDDVFIGMNCIILKGVRLGKGCMVGAGAVVTRDIPDGAIAAGNPATLVGQVGK